MRSFLAQHFPHQRTLGRSEKTEELSFLLLGAPVSTVFSGISSPGLLRQLAEQMTGVEHYRKESKTFPQQLPLGD